MAHVSESEIRAYLETFHNVYVDVATSKLPEDLRNRLARFSQLSRGCLGYVSTQFGAGYEYIDRPGVHITRGSSRIEDLLFEAPKALRSVGPMCKILNASWTLAYLTLEGAFPLRLVGDDSSVRLIRIRAKTGRWVHDIEWAEIFGCRSSQFWSAEMATRRALEELLVGTVDVREMERRSLDLGSFLSRYRQQHVLVLGNFRSGRDQLTTLRSHLDDLGYIPVLADEIPDIREQSLKQKILSLLIACRFIVVEDSTPAGQLFELSYADIAKVVTVVLRQSGQHSSWMTDGISTGSSVIREFEYDRENIQAVMEEAVQWAEGQIRELGTKFDEKYPWRQ